METMIKEEMTVVKKRVSYNMSEATMIGRKHLRLTEDYRCQGLEVITKDGEDYVRASLYHDDPVIDPQEYTVDLPIVLEFVLSAGQLEFTV